MKVASLGSGSKGNATLVRSQSNCILIDCGFSLSQFHSRLQALSVDAEAIDAIFVTHEHSDHASGVERLARRYSIPLYTTVGTARAIGVKGYHPIRGGQHYSLGELEIEAVTVPHDAAEPVQFVITEKGQNKRLGILTDSGHITQHMIDAYHGLHGLMLEFNYDAQMLMQGPYPYALKQRVAGNHGHLSNIQSIELLKTIDRSELSCLVAAHISEKNNSPQLVAELIEQITAPHETVIACQNQGFSWQEI